MRGDQHVIDRRAAAELLGWWLESGVNVAVSEQPRDWRGAAAQATPAPAMPLGDGLMPGELSEFRAWLEQAADLPLAGPGSVRALPRGGAQAEVMVVTDMASLDSQSEPIGGESWELARRMLAAVGITPDQAYLANLSCFSGPGVRLGGPDLDRCAEIARHHIALVQPKRLILFGDSPSKALLGGPVAQKRGKVHKVEGVRTIATFAPAWLLNRPADKALAWRDLLLLMEE